MVPINKEEKEALVKMFPKIHIARTKRQDSKRHHYFMPEDPEYVAALKELRKNIK